MFRWHLNSRLGKAEETRLAVVFGRSKRILNQASSAFGVLGGIIAPQCATVPLCTIRAIEQPRGECLQHSPLGCWPARKDSNLRPSESESDALSSCATGRYLIKTCIGKSYCEFYQEAKMLACKGIFATPSITQACESTGRAKPETCESKSYCVIITHFSPDCKHFLAKSFVFFFYFRLQD